MKKLTRNQFAAFIAVATATFGTATTGTVAKRAGIVWHSANVALRSLQRKGMVVRDEDSKTYRACQIEQLGSVIFVHEDNEAVANAAVKAVA